jgi:hypothetical protein
MKALLRSSVVALLMFAGYAAIATDISKPHSNATIPQPQLPCSSRPGSGGLCVVGK